MCPLILINFREFSRSPSSLRFHIAVVNPLNLSLNSSPFFFASSSSPFFKPKSASHTTAQANRTQYYQCWQTQNTFFSLSFSVFCGFLFFLCFSTLPFQPRVSRQLHFTHPTAAIIFHVSCRDNKTTSYLLCHFDIFISIFICSPRSHTLEHARSKTQTRRILNF